MKALAEFFGILLAVVIVGVIIWKFISAANSALNPGLPKVGKGKKAKGGGDATNDLTRKVIRGAGQLLWKAVTKPFRRP